MTRRAGSVDRVGRDVINRDLRRRVGSHLAAATSQESLMQSLLWILERVDDPSGEEVDQDTRRVVERLFEDLRTNELLVLLEENSSLMGRFCGGCGRDLTPFKEIIQTRRGRPREYCLGSCRQKAYRRRLKPIRRSTRMTAWLAKVLLRTVEEMARADTKELENQILASKVQQILRRRQQMQTPVEPAGPL